MKLSWKAILLCVMLGLSCRASAQWNPLNPVEKVQRQSDGALFTMKRGTLRLRICTDSIIRVTYSPNSSFPKRHHYVVIKTQWAKTAWTFDAAAKDVTLKTSRLSVAVTRSNGVIDFADVAGKKLLEDASRALRPVTVNGERTYHAEDDVAMYGSRQGLYGLGQHQAGVWNYRGEDVELAQQNTEIAIPLMLSSKGYGIFWNNPSRTWFDNRFVHSLYISSEVADTIDYYFFYGPGFDAIIADYRELTGEAPMYGKWAYGYWQSKNRYQSQAELLGVAHKYRALEIPIDNIVQDWFWWTKMGEFKFNQNYPNPKGMVEDLHRNHFHLMISVWPFFEAGSPTYQYMDRHGWFIARTIAPSFHPVGMALYDATNPAARAYYWNLLDRSLFSIGVDAWWLDTDEPETEGREDNIVLSHRLYIGNGARYANLYPLFHAMGVYKGQRAATRQKRVFILSRSAFAGSQRYATTAWSGDVISDWLSFKRQIPAGLNYAVSGMPYWTTDIGGFFIGNPNDPKYRELFVRWFEYGAFCPIFRVHGTRTTNQNELWSYGQRAQAILTRFDRLRYRLMPYVYSLAWMTTSQGYTPMRPLVMDFRTDRRAMNIGDQFMFGPAILVNPVTEPGARSRSLYLPEGKWYDFWTGAAEGGGRAVSASAPLGRIPLYVRAGSVLPLGPELQYAAEKPADPIELRVYPGADGSFTLYEDENDNYDYEKGVYSTIRFHWDDARQTLTIGNRQGKFPGMVRKRTFRIVFVGLDHGAGIGPTAQPDKVVTYCGHKVAVTR
jgi:alpha-D-xyloside xylohydrolase